MLKIEKERKIQTVENEPLVIIAEMQVTDDAAGEKYLSMEWRETKTEYDDCVYAAITDESIFDALSRRAQEAVSHLEKIQFYGDLTTGQFSEYHDNFIILADMIVKEMKKDNRPELGDKAEMLSMTITLGMTEESVKEAEAGKNMPATPKEPKLTLLNMRWGYDGGGVACGPVEGSTLVEIMVRDEEGRSYFVMECRMGEYERILVSEYPMFDIAKHASSYYADFGEEWEKIENVTKESYEFEIYDVPTDEFETSRFFAALKMVRYAMNEAYAYLEPTEEEASDFAADYLDKDLLKMEIPDVVYDADDEDDEDDAEDN